MVKAPIPLATAMGVNEAVFIYGTKTGQGLAFMALVGAALVLIKMPITAAICVLGSNKATQEGNGVHSFVLCALAHAKRDTTATPEGSYHVIRLIQDVA